MYQCNARRVVQSVLGLIGAAILTGCAVPFPVYTISTSNIVALRDANRLVKINTFKGSQTSVSCRLQPISPEGGRTFAKYIQDAFNDEIVVANPKNPPAITVDATLTNIDVDCAMGTASWTIEMDVSVNGQATFAAKVSRTFEGSFAGAIVGQRAYQAFVPTVQEAVKAIISHPTFQSALR